MQGWQGENLKDIILSGGSRLVQHARDLLLASKAHKCYKDTICLWSALAESKGHPTHLSKLQLCHQEGKYLGFILSKEQRSVDLELVQLWQKYLSISNKGNNWQDFLGTGGSWSPRIPGLGSYLNTDRSSQGWCQQKENKRSSSFCSGTGNTRLFQGSELPRTKEQPADPSQSWGHTAALWLLPSSAGAWNSQGSPLGWLHVSQPQQGHTERTQEGTKRLQI